MTGNGAITLTIDAEALEAIVAKEVQRQLAEALAGQEKKRPVSPYMTAAEAAEYLRCRQRRVYELGGEGRLSRHKEGRRVLLLREEVERLVAEP